MKNPFSITNSSKSLTNFLIVFNFSCIVKYQIFFPTSFTTKLFSQGPHRLWKKSSLKCNTCFKWFPSNSSIFAEISANKSRSSYGDIVLPLCTLSQNDIDGGPHPLVHRSPFLGSWESLEEKSKFAIPSNFWTFMYVSVWMRKLIHHIRLKFSPRVYSQKMYKLSKIHHSTFELMVNKNHPIK
jgi:hypothetical protein